MSVPADQDDHTAFPAARIRQVLGETMVALLEGADPRPINEPVFYGDRQVLNLTALAYWIYRHFEADILAGNFCETVRISDLDEREERITLDGIHYRIPHWCYYRLLENEHDPRPLAPAYRTVR